MGGWEQSQGARFLLPGKAGCFGGPLPSLCPLGTNWCDSLLGMRKGSPRKSQQVTQRNGVGVGVLQVPGAQQVPFPLEDMACPPPPPSALVCHAVLFPGAPGQVQELPAVLGRRECESVRHPLSWALSPVSPAHLRVLQLPFTLATTDPFYRGGLRGPDHPGARSRARCPSRLVGLPGLCSVPWLEGGCWRGGSWGGRGAGSPRGFARAAEWAGHTLPPPCSQASVLVLGRLLLLLDPILPSAVPGGMSVTAGGGGGLGERGRCDSPSRGGGGAS